MIFLFSNFGVASLAQHAMAVDTFVVIDPSDAPALPHPIGGTERFALILYDGVQAPEIVWCSNNANNGELTVERGQEGTVAKNWATGTAVINGLTKASIGYFTTGGQDDWIAVLQGNIDAVIASVTLEANARVSADDAFAELIATVQSDFNDNVAQVQALAQAFADINTAWSIYQISVSADVKNANANASTALTASVDNGIAIAALDVDVTAMLDGKTSAAFATHIKALDTADAAQVTWNTTMDARVGTAEASLSSEITTQASNYLALVKADSTLTASIAGVKADLTTETTLRASETGALATRASKLEATVDTAGTGLTARLGTLESAVASDSAAQATRLTTLEAQTANTAGSGLQSRIATEETARATADSTETTARKAADSTLTTDLGTVKSDLTTESTTRAAADTALTTTTTTLTSQMADKAGSGLQSRISTEESTRATADSTEATARTALDSRFTTSSRAVANQIPSDFAADGTYWGYYYTPATDLFSVYTGAQLAFVDVAGMGHVLQGTNVTIPFTSRGYYLVLPSQTWQVTLTRKVTSGVSSYDYVGWIAYDANDTYIGHYYISNQGHTPADGVVTTSFQFTTADIFSYYPTAVRVRPLCFIGYDVTGSGVSTAVTAVSKLELVNVTPAIAAKTYADAGIATEASTRATADTAETTARTAADSKLTTDLATANAAITTESGTRASADTAAAATVTAIQSTLTGITGSANSSLNPNPMFQQWSGGFPVSWSSLGTVSGAHQVAGDTPGSYGFQIDAAAGVNSYEGVSSSFGVLQPNMWVVLEWDLRLASGALTCSLFLLRLWNAARSASFDIVYKSTTTTDITETAPGVGTVGKTYRFRKLLKLTQLAAVDNYDLYILSHYDALSGESNAAANSITWLRALLRPATDQEIASGNPTTGVAATNAIAVKAAADIITESSTRATADAATTTLTTSLSSSITAINANTGGYLNVNADFHNYTTSPGVPNGWTDWNAGGTGTRATGRVSANAYQNVGTGGSMFGIVGYGPVGSITNGLYVIDVLVEFPAGADIGGSGVYFAPVKSDGSNCGPVSNWQFKTDVKPVGRATTIGSTVDNGVVYAFSIPVDLSNATTYPNPSYFALYALSAWNGWTIANHTTRWSLLGLRPATEAERQGIAGLTQSTTNAATLTTQAATLVTLDGRTQAYYQIIAAAGGTPAYLRMNATGYGSEIAMAAKTISMYTSASGGFFTKVMELISNLVQLSVPLNITIGTSTLCFGPGIGASADLVAWYGLTQVPTAMTKANAIFWMDNAGLAYFGGGLNVGYLTTARTTTDLSSGATVSTPDATSNGHTITVTLSYALTSITNTVYGASAGAAWDSAAAGLPGFTTGMTTFDSGWTNEASSTTITLDRSLNGAAFAYTGQTLSTLGQYRCSGVRPNGADPGFIKKEGRATNSLTYTDSSMVAQTRAWRATMTSRTWTTGFAGAIATQTVTITSVEAP